LRTLIAGGGVAGLAAARALRSRGLGCTILEGSGELGGLACTDQADGFSFDRTGHVLHFSRPEVRAEFEALGVPLTRTERRAAVVVRDAVVPYPFQFNLWALGDPGLARRALKTARQAHAGRDPNPASFAGVLAGAWGETMEALFFRPYNEKLWGRGLEELPPDCAGDFLPDPQLDLVEEGIRGPTGYTGYNAHFLYPASGRLGDVIDALARPLQPQVHLHSTVASVDLERRTAATRDGREFPFDHLISTMPLPALLAAAKLPLPEGGLLDATRVGNVRVRIRGRMLSDLHWIYTPDPSVVFHRVGFPANLNPRTCPPGCISLSIEHTIPREGERRGSGEIAVSAVEYLVRVGLIEVESWSAEEIVLSPAYVVWRAAGRPWFREMAEMLRERGVLLAGRFGTWEYLSLEGAYASGMAAAEAVAGREVARV
jgi:protoporphyrinogen oxidase